MRTVPVEKVRTTIKKAKTRWQTVSHVTRITLFVIVLILIAARAAAPLLVRHYVNGELNRNKDYAGRIGTVHIALIRGAYSIDHIDILKRSGKVPVPFFSARSLAFSVEWRELFHGKIVSKVWVDQPRINFVNGPTPEQSQTSASKNWIATIQHLYPFDINRCELREGQVWYHDFHSTPPVHVYVTNLVVVATNLTNTRQLNNPLPADFQVHGTTIGHGDLQIDLRMNPIAPKPTFDLKAAVTNMDMTALNEFMRAYTKADVRQGILNIYTQIQGANGLFHGYVKPLTEHLKVFNTENKTPVQVVWEAIVAFLTQTFKNHPENRFATVIPFSGSFDNPKVGIWQTVINVLHNTFIRAIPPGLEPNTNSGQAGGAAAGQQPGPGK
jgi:hypothetical protein